MSICATTDTGFTVVGSDVCNDANGGYNAFAAHFVPKPPSDVKKAPVSASKPGSIRYVVAGSRVVFTMPDNYTGEKVSVEVFDGRGKRVGMTEGNKIAVWKAKNTGAGVYFWKSRIVTGKSNCGSFLISNKQN